MVQEPRQKNTVLLAFIHVPFWGVRLKKTYSSGTTNFRAYFVVHAQSPLTNIPVRTTDKLNKAWRNLRTSSWKFEAWNKGKAAQGVRTLLLIGLLDVTTYPHTSIMTQWLAKIAV